MNKPHVIRFREESYPAFQNAKGKFLGNDKVEVGFCLEALLHPHIIENEVGEPIEVADLELSGGEVLYAVPFAHFEFINPNEEDK